MSDAPLGPSIQGYQPLTRMQEKAAQLRQELDAASKTDRHAQFKSNSSRALGTGTQTAAGPAGAWQSPAAAAAAASSRRVGRSVTGHSVTAITATPQLPAPTASPAPAPASPSATGSDPLSSVTPAGTGSGAVPPASRLSSSRRVSNASGAPTDNSGDEARVTNNGTRKWPHEGRGVERSLGSRVADSSSPPGRRPARPSRGPVFRDVSDPAVYAAAISRQNQLEDQVAELEERSRSLSVDNERRQESYMRREAHLMAEVSRLEGALRVARGESAEQPTQGKTSSNMRGLHAQVVSQIEDLLDAQAACLRKEESTMLRRFSTRLAELEAAVAAERTADAAKREAEPAELLRALAVERDKMEAIATLLDKKHSLAAEEAGRLRAQFKLQEEDREYLIRQTLALKKENQALRNQVAALSSELSTLAAEKEDLALALSATGAAEGGSAGGGLSSVPGGGSASRLGSARLGMAGSVTDGNAVQVKIQRYEEVIDSLKRLLEAERRRTKQARAAHLAELAQRTELAGVLRQCVDGVREQRKALEADTQRERQAAERASARARPLSALRPPPPAASVARPLSALLLPASRRHTSTNRPTSGRISGHHHPHHVPSSPSPISPSGKSSISAAAAAAPDLPRGTGDGSMSPSPWQGHSQTQIPTTPTEGGSSGAGPNGLILTPGERKDLIAMLLGQEEVLRALFDRAFPGVTPHPPSDPHLEKLAAWQDARDAQVVANAKVLAANKNALSTGSALRDSTPGGILMKEAAGRPWVLNVDSMLSEFLGGGGSGGPGGWPSRKSMNGAGGGGGGGTGGGG